MLVFDVKIDRKEAARDVFCIFLSEISLKLLENKI
jgi:hypothetical protein